MLDTAARVAAEPIYAYQAAWDVLLNHPIVCRSFTNDLATSLGNQVPAEVFRQENERPTNEHRFEKRNEQTGWAITSFRGH